MMLRGVLCTMHEKISIAAAIAAAAIIMTMPPRKSLAQVSPPAGAGAPATSDANPPPTSGTVAHPTVAHPKHHKKKQSFMHWMRGKLEKSVHKAVESKKTLKNTEPAKTAGPSPSQIE